MILALDKAKVLKQAKHAANWWLFISIVGFLLSFLLPYLRLLPTWMIGLVRSASEAAIVGGLADWFAVTALFRPVNVFGFVPIFPSHTAIIPKSKDSIASILGEFIPEHFLKTEDLISIVRRHNPAQMVADWFLQKSNSENFGRHGANLLSKVIQELHEESVQGLISKTLRDAVKSVDLSRKGGEILEVLVSDGKHNELLDQAIASLKEMLGDPGARANIAAKIANFIRDEYPVGQILVPTEAVGTFVAGKIAGWIDSYLGDVFKQPDHELREAFNDKVKTLIVHLKGSREFAEKGEEIKQYILSDEKFTSFVRSLWASIRDSVERDLRNDHSEIYQKLVATGDWIGTTLRVDNELRSSLNRQAESLVEEFGPALGKFVSEHIEGTVNGWDANDMSALIEGNIGAKLQKIRINGTMMGGILGGVLFGIACILSR